MQKLGLYVLTPVLSFFGGFAAYVWVLNTYWNQELGNEAASVLINGGMAYIALAIPLYFLNISFIDKKVYRFKILLYPLSCMLLFFFPTLLILLIWGGANPFAAESLLFHSFFFISGFLFGSLNWFFKMVTVKKDNKVNRVS